MHHDVRRNPWSVVAWLALLAAALMMSPARAQPDHAPAWQLQTPDGETVRYPEDAQGQPTVLLFWPSWCPYSRALQPYVQDIWKDYREAGVKVWTINIKEDGDPMQAMRERGLSFPLLLNGDDLIARYAIERTPWFLVIDGQQRIVYTRPGNQPSPVEVAKQARGALNRLLGARAVPLPASYPAPYDLHLRKTPSTARQASAAASDAEWRPWAASVLAEVRAEETVAGVAPLGAIDDGRDAILQARALWTQRYGTEPTRTQAPYRAFRKGNLWLVSGLALPGRLGQGYLLIVAADDGRVLRLSGGDQP
jgi:thiol-disulfide isomerase/thioredoxin